MILNQVFEPLIIEVTPQTNGSQNDDLPIVHALPSDISTRIHIEIGGDELNDFEPELWVGIKELQPCQ
jgi:hypothetical protein